MDLTNNFLNHRLSLQSNKPIMEKKRRARINHCLNELKTLILEAMKKDVSVPNLFLLLTQQPKAKKISKISRDLHSSAAIFCRLVASVV